MPLRITAKPTRSAVDNPGQACPTLSGWGRLPVPGRELLAENLERLSKDATLCRGLGRSYGDASLPAPGDMEVIGSRLADRMLVFDADKGVLRAESGLSLKEMNRLLLPRGWFAPVTPGTQFVTLGGMVAADIHGKNHHKDGCLGRHVRSLKMRVANGDIVECSMHQERELFFATIGGMGLTGHILEVELQLAAVPSPWILCESERVSDLAHMLAGMEEARSRWPFTVGWFDCMAKGASLGRGIFLRGRWAGPEEAPDHCPVDRRSTTVPWIFPGWVLNASSIRLFNQLYYQKHRRIRKRSVVSPFRFFYPLDGLLHWNRMYGPRGFIQYQCVLPATGSDRAVVRFLTKLTDMQVPSFLGVIKDCGREGRGMLSFPMQGVSIALDIPMHAGIQQIVNDLNAFLIEEGGRIYLAKDALTRAEHFMRMEPRLEAWLAVRRAWDPDLRIRSALSVRLFGDDR